ncbi:hypothetical protein T484DRAFT_2805343 [Baffinella frigidus]|nr:hypothetical protein T484DRAFT_2805343 [Cryptophyta sp. CCMP2293]
MFGTKPSISVPEQFIKPRAGCRHEAVFTLTENRAFRLSDLGVRDRSDVSHHGIELRIHLPIQFSHLLKAGPAPPPTIQRYAPPDIQRYVPPPTIQRPPLLDIERCLFLPGTSTTP